MIKLAIVFIILGYVASGCGQSTTAAPVTPGATPTPVATIVAPCQDSKQETCPCVLQAFDSFSWQCQAAKNPNPPECGDGAWESPCPLLSPVIASTPSPLPQPSPKPSPSPSPKHGKGKGKK